MTSTAYKEQSQWLSDFYKEAAMGRQMQCLSTANQWVDADWGPSMHADKKLWRLKPEPTKAWVVWDDEGWRKITKIKPDAERFAESINGTIQEITRPD